MTRQGRTAILALFFVVVFGPALVLRLHPVTSEAFAYDAVVSQMAADKGVVANALDLDGTLWDRRGHPPLLAYIIVANNALFGAGPFGARIFSILAGALGCLIAAITVKVLSHGQRWSLPGALFAGWMLCFLPVHLYVSRTANWDAVYALLAGCALFCSSLHWARPTRPRLAATLIFSALAFLTCEIGVTLLPAVGLLLGRDIRRHGVAAAWRMWRLPLAAAGGVLVLLWPAGILKLDLLRTLRFRLADSMISERNLPWWMFYVELFRQAPAFTIAAAAGVVGWAALAIARALPRRPPQDAEAGRGALPSFAVLAPFALYVVAAFLLSLKQRLVFVHHIVDMLPPLVVLAGTLLARSWTRKRVARLALILACVAVLGGSMAAGLRSDPEIAGPQEHPGLLGVRDYLRDHPGGRIYCYYARLWAFYMPEAKCEGARSQEWSDERIAHVKTEDFDFVVTDWSQFDARHPDIGSLAAALGPEYRLAHTIRHRRTHEPVAWIFRPS